MHPRRAIPNGTRWWIDTTGGFHMTTPDHTETERVHAGGLVDPVRRTGTIERVRGRLAVVGCVPSEIIDVLEARFPGTRWIIADPAPTPQHADTV